MKHELRHTPCAGGIAVARNERVELVGADARHAVLGAEALPNPLADGADEPIGRHGSEARLDAGEAVEIEREEGVGGATFASGAVQRLLECGDELLLLLARGGHTRVAMTRLESM